MSTDLSDAMQNEDYLVESALTGTLPDDDDEGRLTPIEELVNEETAEKIRKAAADKQKANEVADSFFHEGLCADKGGYATASLQARAAEKAYFEVRREAYREFRATRKREAKREAVVADIPEDADSPCGACTP
jgi:hypothetical protein